MFSFDSRRKAVEVASCIRRICDLTTPNCPAGSQPLRTSNRSNRSIPALLCPWDGSPRVDQCRLGITSDLSDQGVGLVLTHPIRPGGVVLGFWLDDPDMDEAWYFLGELVRCQPIGAGFWVCGVDLSEFANTSHRAKLSALLPVAKKLRCLSLEPESEPVQAEFPGWI